MFQIYVTIFILLHDQFPLTRYCDQKVSQNVLRTEAQLMK